MNEADEYMNKGDIVAKAVGFTQNNKNSFIGVPHVDLLNKGPKVKATA